MRILITGGEGYIGKSLQKGLSHYRVDVTSRTDLDLTDKEATNKWFRNKYYDVVIHTAISGGSRQKTDTSEVVYNNLQMFYNLYDNRENFSKFIHFGSGAEIYNDTSYYGLSKRVINQIIEITPAFYNFRIFGVFDENELSTRFIKANILRNIVKKALIIHQNMRFDFFYMKDLISLVDSYITSSSSKLPKVLECCYSRKYTLLDIAEMINNIGEDPSPINFSRNGRAEDYIGYNSPEVIKMVGLEQGIINTYNKLNENNGSIQ